MRPAPAEWIPRDRLILTAVRYLVTAIERLSAVRFVDLTDLVEERGDPAVDVGLVA